LYEAARQFQIMAPWDWMGDGAVLGIINELGMRLVCVLGAMGEVFWICPLVHCTRIGLGVDAGSGMILGFQLNGPDKTMVEAVSAGLIQCIRTAGKRPATVRVASGNLAHALRPLADSLKIKLLQVKILPMASEARRSLERFGGGS